jgi:hypothetical protein
MSNPPISVIQTLNPYRGAAIALAHRILWDLSPLSWRSRHALRTWRNSHVGKKAVILCNGPSLNKLDFGYLDGCFTFGLNKINLLFDRSSFRPSALVAVNNHVIEQNAAFFNTTTIPVFLDYRGRRYVDSRHGIIFLHATNLRGFAYDCSVSVDQGHTVTYVALQIAAHMGFRDVALVGCDHNFATRGPANATVVAGDTDPNHFDPRYFANGVSWDLPDLIQSEISYLFAKQAFENLGGRVVNCTDGGKLEIFPRMSLAEFLSHS